NTQMLIDQSKELGIWRDAGKTATDLLTDGMTKLVDKLNVFLDRLATGIVPMPAPWQNWPPPPAVPDYGGGGGGDVPTFGPEVFVPSPRRAIVGTHGGEYVLHKDTVERMVRGSGGRADNSDILEELRMLRNLLPIAIRDAIQRS